MGRYDPYLLMEKPVSKRHGKMPRENRAKQFAPFSAVKGHAEAIQAKEKLVVPRRVLSEDAAEILNRTILRIRKKDIVTAVYYCEEDGQYLQVTGMVSRIDLWEGVLQVVETEILFKNLFDLQIEKFSTLEVEV